MADPISQRGALDLDPFAQEDRRLAVERQPVEILADHHTGDKAGTGPALLDRQLRGGRLDDPLAGPATQLRPDMADHLQAGGNLLQHLGDVLANPREASAAAAGAD